MTQENMASENPRDALNLKIPEPEVSADSPWDDDALDRKQIAERLTNLIRTQSVPFVVSIDGYWGTGKTFMLKRWQKDLENQNYQAIYFNAWEDDFCDDPLLAIIGQLSEHLKNSNFQSIVDRVVQVAKPLIRQNALGVLNKATGLTWDVQPDEQRDYLQEYLEQRATKDEIRRLLQDLSQSVVDATGHPLVFIIDELDRCRPTFAIELLERVKHIFDVPNLVFVFGINRDELCSSLQSVYGEIDAGVYLRRFFDLEFTLPEVDSQVFCKHLFEKFELEDFFRRFSTSANTNQHLEDYRQFSTRIPELWSYFGMSLRDVDYCVRSIALACSNLKPHASMYPWLLGLLIALTRNNPNLYRKLVKGECFASEVMNYVYSLIPQDDGYSVMARTLALIEGYLYVIEGNSRRAVTAQSQFFDLLNEKKTLNELSQSELLSERIRKAFELKEKGIFNKEDMDVFSKVPEGRIIAILLETMTSAQRNGVPDNSLEYFTEMIDFHQEMIRR